MDNFSLHITLPSGATVTFRDPEDLTGADHQRVVSAIQQIDRVAAAGMDALYGTACMLIEAWSVPYAPGRPRQPSEDPWPLPSTDPTLLGKLSMRDYGALTVAVSPVASILFPAPVIPDDAGVPGTPTQPADA